MAEREQIAVIFINNNKWIAGSYYILNLICALNTVEETKKPSILLLCTDKEDFDYAMDYTKYPYLKYVEYKFHKFNFLKRIINVLGKSILKSTIFKHPKIQLDVKFVFPTTLYSINTNAKILAWIPDFQEKHLPHFFTWRDRLTRNETYLSYLKNKIPIVFSSKDAKNDFDTFYKNHDENEKYVLPFAVTLPTYENEDINDLKLKYSLSRQYFFCANQFWMHKNHMFLFETIKLLKDKGTDILIICSGNTKDYRNPNYFKEIEQFINKNNLHENIKILGFIDRSEQLCLMKNARAIIQPSLFEGWSTVVEDAKALNKYVILSDLKVHREQIDKNVLFFNPKDKTDLITVIEDYLKSNYIEEPIDYTKNIIEFGNKLINIIDEF